MEKELLLQLVTKAQKGDSAAFDELFTAFYNDVYYFALKTLKDPDLACDITQETFLEIIKTLPNLREPAAFVSWMKQITYHQCTRYFKKKKDVLVDEDEDGSTIFDELEDESSDSIPAEVYEKEEFRSTVLNMINSLTEEQRSAVMLYYFDELSVGEIAEIQGVAEGTVKSRLNYARKAVKRSVEDYEKKTGTKLRSVAFLPLFLLFFKKAEAMPPDAVAKVQKAVSEAAAATTVSAAAATAAKTGFWAKISSIPLVGKIAAGSAAAIVVAGSIIGVITARDNNALPQLDSPAWYVCDGTMYISPVENSQHYVITNHDTGEHLLTTAETEIPFDEITDDPADNISVVAVANEGYEDSSPACSYYSDLLTDYLPAPMVTLAEDGTLTITKLDGADGYEIFTDNFDNGVLVDERSEVFGEQSDSPVYTLNLIDYGFEPGTTVYIRSYLLQRHSPGLDSYALIWSRFRNTVYVG
ncbi:MAG: RNA polymerase sigma factor [Oscillospiraceae bacterium]|nr:RNA polymerase sigma factor [Oscillospiraceae bacterium]